MTSTRIFTQIGLDSGALTLLGAVVHPMSRPGEYRGVVHEDGEEVGGFAVTVVAEGAGEGADQVNVDLADPGRTGAGCGCDGGSHGGSLRAGGHLLLHVGSGDRALAAVLATDAGEDSRAVFDSRELDKGDLFAATLLRPGRYRLANAAGGAATELVVRYPERGRVPLRALAPVQVEVGDGIRPAEISVAAGQGLLCTVTSAARIVIELVEPDDRAPEPGRPRYRRVRRPVRR